METHYLSFSLGKQLFAVQIDSVREICQLGEVTSVPGTPALVVGVVHLRGKIVPVVDLRMKFGAPVVDHGRESCIIVIETGEGLVGALVDKVHDVREFKNIEAQSDLQFGSEKIREFVAGLGKTGDTILVIVDLAKALEKDNLQMSSPKGEINP